MPISRLSASPTTAKLLTGSRSIIARSRFSTGIYARPRAPDLERQTRAPDQSARPERQTRAPDQSARPERQTRAPDPECQTGSARPAAIDRSTLMEEHPVLTARQRICEDGHRFLSRSGNDMTQQILVR